MQKMRLRFLEGKVEEGNFRYIGFQLTQNSKGVLLDHSSYMEQLCNLHIESKRALQKQDQLTAEEQKHYRKLIGQLYWAVQGSRH